MLFALSPAKNLNEKDPAPIDGFTQPDLLVESEIPTETLRGLVSQQIAELMHISDRIALLSAERNAARHTPFIPDNARQAAFMFNGDVCEGFDVASLTPEQTDYLQQYVRLLSGLYDVSRPLDLMQPYRLEMSIPLASPCDRNPYESWDGRITSLLNDTLAQAGANVPVNLTSQEYFRSVNTRKLNARLITPVFRDEKNGKYKVISLYTKHAHGPMVRYVAEHGIISLGQLKGFNYEGYRFNEAASGVDEWIFLREE